MNVTITMLTVLLSIDDYSPLKRCYEHVTNLSVLCHLDTLQFYVMSVHLPLKRGHSQGIRE